MVKNAVVVLVKRMKSKLHYVKMMQHTSNLCLSLLLSSSCLSLQDCLSNLRAKLEKSMAGSACRVSGVSRGCLSSSDSDVYTMRTPPVAASGSVHDACDKVSMYIFCLRFVSSRVHEFK